MLNVRDLHVEIGGRTIVAGASFEVRPGDKVGLVGRNGAGKTTLFRVLGGADEPRAGQVRRSPATGYLSQDPRQRRGPRRHHRASPTCCRAGASTPPPDASRSSAWPSRTTRRSATSSASPTAQERFEVDGGYAAEAEVHRLVDGLGLRADRLDLPLGALSGGERRRVELARILFAGSDLLLLDEPTNHLDADARDWLLRFLRSYRGALLVVSHDLDLLDEAITRVIHLDREPEDDRRRARRVQGHLQPVPRRPPSATRSARPASPSARPPRSTA